MIIQVLGLPGSGKIRKSNHIDPRRDSEKTPSKL